MVLRLPSEAIVLGSSPSPGPKAKGVGRRSDMLRELDAELYRA